MINVDWNTVQDTEYPGAGGYAAKIIKVEDNSAKEYLMVYFDIADGKFKNYAQKTYEEKGFYPYRMPWSYKQKALWFFKLKKMAVEETNKGFVFKNDPQSLVGKFCGIVLGEEEYRANDGKKKKRLYVAEVISGQKFRNGDFAVPDLKKLEETDYPPVNAPSDYSNDFAMIKDDDANLPF